MAEFANKHARVRITAKGKRPKRGPCKMCNWKVTKRQRVGGPSDAVDEPAQWRRSDYAKSRVSTFDRACGVYLCDTCFLDFHATDDNGLACELVPVPGAAGGFTIAVASSVTHTRSTSAGAGRGAVAHAVVGGAAGVPWGRA